jgi:hypothetical protein
MRASTGLRSRLVSVGLSESGRRREKGPQSDRIKVGPDSYVGPDHSSVGGPAGGIKAKTRPV